MISNIYFFLSERKLFSSKVKIVRHKYFMIHKFTELSFYII